MAITILSSTAAFAAGCTTHNSHLNYGEHHLYGVRNLQILLAVCATATASQASILHIPLSSALLTTSILTILYLTGVLTSLLTYRLLLSPLTAFPGPLGCAFSNLYFPLHLSKLDAHCQVQKLHQQYGDIVRIGSNYLSIIDPKAVHVIYGLGSKYLKAAWYDLSLPMIAISTAREPEVHTLRRKDWNPAFGERAMRGYEERINPCQDQLIQRLIEFKGGEVDVTKWFGLYSFDVMGDLAYGKSFGMMENEEFHWAVKLQSDGMKALGFMFPMWLFRVLLAIPGATRDWFRFIDFGTEKLEERMAAKETIPDIMTTLLAPFQDRTPSACEFQLLRGDSQAIIVAGSDTSSTALVYIFYFLSTHPEHMIKLRAELGTCPDLSHKNLQGLNHLNGIIHEALRLYPPVPTSLPRQTPVEGIMVGNTHIPGDTTVWVPQYALGRSAAAYVRPEEFIPERWYSRPELVKEKSAWAPFSKGEYGCVGKPLALMNIRMLVARLVWMFDVSMAEGECGSGVCGGEEDRFTLAPGSLRLVFKERKD